MIYFIFAMLCLSNEGPYVPEPPEPAKGCNGLPG